MDSSFFPGVGIVPGRQSGSWSAAYVLEQQLWADPCNDQRNIGLMSQWGIADRQTCPYEWGFNVSLQAQGLLPRRERDGMGIAYFYSGLSGQLKNFFNPLVPISDVHGGEAVSGGELDVIPQCVDVPPVEVVELCQQPDSAVPGCLVDFRHEGLVVFVVQLSGQTESQHFVGRAFELFDHGWSLGVLGVARHCWSAVSTEEYGRPPTRGACRESRQINNADRAVTGRSGWTLPS